jgi:class 3 adenylate cyclase
MIHRLSALIGLILEPRRSPNLRVRAVWWVCFFGLLTLGWSFPGTRALVDGLWTMANSFYVLAAVCWSLFHPRHILRGREVSLRWSVLLTLLAALVMFSQLYSLIQSEGRQFQEGANNIAAIIVVATVLAAPLLFLLILGVGILGAMVGAFAMRRSANPRQATGTAINIWYSGLMFSALWASVDQHHSDPRHLFTYGLPLLTVAWCRVSEGRDALVKRTRARLTRWLEAALVLRWNLRGRRRRLDLRGGALGLLAAAAMLAAPTVLIAPLKTLALVTLMQARAASLSRLHLPTLRTMAKLGNRDEIVILTLDPETRYRILHDRSEAAIQAEMIDRLSRWGAGALVLPAPLVHDAQYHGSDDQAAPSAAATQRCRRDLRHLAETVHQHPNVIVTLPPDRHHLFDDTGNDEDNGKAAAADDALQTLYRVAHLALADLPLSTVVHLPIVPAHMTPGALVPVPVELSQRARNGKSAALQHQVQPLDLSVLVGSPLPQITPEGVLVNFLGDGPRYDFKHLSYNTLLQGEMVDATSPDQAEQLGEGRWVKPEEYFRRRQTVFLDSVVHPLRMTPLGVMSQSEELAYATATLLSGQSIRPIPAISLVLITLFTGLCIGGACFRRDPIDAIWRATIPMFLIALVSLCAFGFGGVWLDPVLPLGTAVIALGIVTQLSFAQERTERRRTRALFQRFVASDQMDNWLAMPEDALALGGKRQTVCVLFADVRNFTPFAEQHEADKVIEVINAYMSGLTEALHRHGGVLDKYTGDGLMAWFPVRSDPHVDLKNAVNAALAMRDAAIEISTRMPEDEQLDIGIGLHYGDAVVGLVGSEKLQINWTAMGRTVVISARLQTIALGGEVVISERVHQAIAGVFTVIEGEPVMVKGLSMPVRPFRVLGCAPEGGLAVVSAPTAPPALLPPPPASQA